MMAGTSDAFFVFVCTVDRFLAFHTYHCQRGDDRLAVEGECCEVAVEVAHHLGGDGVERLRPHHLDTADACSSLSSTCWERIGSKSRTSSSP